MRRPKDDAIFQALGDVDELNSAVGMSRELVADLEPKLAQQVGRNVHTSECAAVANCNVDSTCGCVTRKI